MADKLNLSTTIAAVSYLPEPTDWWTDESLKFVAQVWATALSWKRFLFFFFKIKLQFVNSLLIRLGNCSSSRIEGLFLKSISKWEFIRCCWIKDQNDGYWEYWQNVSIEFWTCWKELEHFWISIKMARECPRSRKWLKPFENFNQFETFPRTFKSFQVNHRNAMKRQIFRIATFHFQQKLRTNFQWNLQNCKKMKKKKTHTKIADQFEIASHFKKLRQMTNRTLEVTG